MGKSPYGHPQGYTNAAGVWVRAYPALTLAALIAIPAKSRDDGDINIVTADGSQWMYDAASTAAADPSSTLVVAPADGVGRWFRMGSFDLKIAIGFALADAAVLSTVPTGKRLLIEQAYWEVTTSWTGGTSSAIGISSDVAPHDTKGDILGGAGGDVAAALVSTGGATKQGTIGVSYSAAPKMVVLEAGSKIRFDRIVDAFTAGAGFAHLAGRLIG